MLIGIIVCILAGFWMTILFHQFLFERGISCISKVRNQHYRDDGGYYATSTRSLTSEVP